MRITIIQCVPWICHPCIPTEWFCRVLIRLIITQKLMIKHPIPFMLTQTAVWTHFISYSLSLSRPFFFPFCSSSLSSSVLFSLYFMLYFLSVCAHMYICVHTCKNQSFPFTLWVPEIKFWSSGWGLDTFTHKFIFPAPMSCCYCLLFLLSRLT